MCVIEMCVIKMCLDRLGIHYIPHTTEIGFQISLIPCYLQKNFTYPECHNIESDIVLPDPWKINWNKIIINKFEIIVDYQMYIFVNKASLVIHKRHTKKGTKTDGNHCEWRNMSLQLNFFVVCLDLHKESKCQESV